ncbi:hypothetical protein [Hyphococcus sp.]|uniref:hypothetical protein n=1 Tax=Hyphococcus sp. TaxID=2038636 RepID=UPI003CCC035C
MAQLISVAHAEADHNAHQSTSSCAICCVNFSDDDFDAPTPAAAIGPVVKVLQKEFAPVPQITVIRFHSNFIVRGPPHN